MGTLSTPHLDDDASYLPVHIQYVCIPGTLVDGRPVGTQPEGWDGKCASGYMDTWDSCVICIRASGVCHCHWQWPAQRPDLFYGVIEVEDSLRTGTVVAEAGKSRLHALGRIVP